MSQLTEKNPKTLRKRADRAISDLVLAELFLVQATIESASALGDGISGLREHLYWEDTMPEEELSAFLRRTRDELVEPYSSRFRYFREMLSQEAA